MHISALRIVSNRMKNKCIADENIWILGSMLVMITAWTPFKYKSSDVLQITEAAEKPRNFYNFKIVDMYLKIDTFRDRISFPGLGKKSSERIDSKLIY